MHVQNLSYCNKCLHFLEVSISVFHFCVCNRQNLQTLPRKTKPRPKSVHHARLFGGNLQEYLEVSSANVLVFKNIA